MLKFSGSIRLEGQCIGRIVREKDGSAEITCEDAGSGEMNIRFSSESFRRLSEAVLGFALGKENVVRFGETGGFVAADGFLLMIDDQAVQFNESDDDPGPEDFPTININLVSGKDDLTDGLDILINEEQARELRRRLDGYLQAIALRRETAKPKRINPPAKPKTDSARAST